MHFPIIQHRVEISQISYPTPFSLDHHALSTRMGMQLAAFVRARISTETTVRRLFPHFNTSRGSIWLKWCPSPAARCATLFTFLFVLLKAYLHVILPNILSTAFRMDYVRSSQLFCKICQEFIERSEIYRQNFDIFSFF